MLNYCVIYAGIYGKCDQSKISASCHIFFGLLRVLTMVHGSWIVEVFNLRLSYIFGHF